MLEKDHGEMLSRKRMLRDRRKVRNCEQDRVDMHAVDSRAMDEELDLMSQHYDSVRHVGCVWVAYLTGLNRFVR